MKYKIYSLLAASLAIATVSCDKKFEGLLKAEQINTSKAYLKIVHASPSFRAIHNAPDSFNIFVNGKKINSTFLTYNGMWPFSVNATTNSTAATYAAVEPGTNTIKLSVPGKASTFPDSAAIFSIDKTLTGGKYYTLLITDSIKMQRDSSKIFVEDQFNELPSRDGYINFRFVNAAMNDTAGKAVNLSSFSRNAILFSNVKPGQLTGFGQFGWNIAVGDTFYVRRFVPSSTQDTGRILAKVFVNTALIGGGTPFRRSVTLYYKGDANLTTGTKARSLAAYINE